MGHQLLCLLSLGCALSLVSGHGRLIKPPARGTAWRYGFSTPKNYNDNQLYCGGAGVQWGINGGKCGVCGDPYQGPWPHEAGGKYATGTIVDAFTEGQTIDIAVEITANHLGFFEFSICPVPNKNTKATVKCMENNLLQLQDGSGTKHYIGSPLGIITTSVKLPQGLVCSQCVLRWRYHTGNSWGTDPATGDSGLGFGPQEEFYGCADVKITASLDDVTALGSQMQPTTTETPHTTHDATPTTAPATTENPTATTTSATNNHWGTDPAAEDSGLGFGPREELYGWADATITAYPDGVTTLGSQTQPTTTETPHTTHDANPTTVPATTKKPNTTNAPLSATTAATTAATTKCPDAESPNNKRPPPSGNTGCQAVGPWTGNKAMIEWCILNCALGFCPASHCLCP